MSRIWFHSIDKSGVTGLLKRAGVRGSERAYFGNLFCADVTWAVFRLLADESTGRQSILRNIFPEDHYALRRDCFAEDAALYFRLAEGTVMFGEKKVNLFTLQLNTTYYLGSDPVRLGVRLHAQSEIHAYVEGPNRRWLADIIRQGRAFEFFHGDAGWESVIKLLKEDDSSPVVTSYSVCNSFPNEEVAGFVPVLSDPQWVDGEKNWDAWDTMPAQEQWDMGIAGLRRSGGGLEMKPENWDDYYFGDGMDANQFVVELRKLYPDS